jgi:predicted permease
MGLLPLFTDNLLPIFLATGAGFLLADRLKTDPRPLSQVAFNVLTPCLMFRVVAEGRLPADAVLRMAGFTVVAMLVPAAIAFAASRLLGWSRARSSAVVLCALLPNSGNFGLSASVLAFGPAGLKQASLFFLASSVVTFTVGVLVASLGRVGPRAALLGLLKVPALWAVALAFLLAGRGLALPHPALRAVNLLADGCIPAFLVILGMQLRQSGSGGPALPVALASGLRLAGGAAIGLVLAPLLGLEGAARQAGVLQSATPSAVITTILATEYDVEPAFVTSVVLLTTLLSPLTLTGLLALLGQG